MTSQLKRGGHGQARGHEQERKQFDRLLSELGAYELARRIDKLPSFKAYDQRYPLDSAATTVPLDDVINETAYVDAPAPKTPETLFNEVEDENQMYSVLPPLQHYVIQQTVDGYKPHEIAVQLGHKDSNIVRQNKFKALRTLNIPIRLEKRRTNEKN